MRTVLTPSLLLGLCALAQAQPHTLERHTLPAHDALFLPSDGPHPLALLRTDTGLHVVQLPDGDTVCTLPPQADVGPLRSARQTGSMLVLAGDEGLCAVDTAHDAVYWVAPPDHAQHVELVGESRVVVSDDTTLTFLDLYLGTVTGRVEFAAREVWWAHDPDGDLAVAARGASADDPDRPRVTLFGFQGDVRGDFQGTVQPGVRCGRLPARGWVDLRDAFGQPLSVTRDPELPLGTPELLSPTLAGWRDGAAWVYADVAHTDGHLTLRPHPPLTDALPLEGDVWWTDHPTIVRWNAFDVYGYPPTGGVHVLALSEPNRTFGSWRPVARAGDLVALAQSTRIAPWTIWAVWNARTGAVVGRGYTPRRTHWTAANDWILSAGPGGLLALRLTPSTPLPSLTDTPAWLADQQDDDGAWRARPTVHLARRDLPIQLEPTPDLRATALAGRALALAGDHDDAVVRALQWTTAYLLDLTAAPWTSSYDLTHAWEFLQSTRPHWPRVDGAEQAAHTVANALAHVETQPALRAPQGSWLEQLLQGQDAEPSALLRARLAHVGVPQPPTVWEPLLHPDDAGVIYTPGGRWADPGEALPALWALAAQPDPWRARALERVLLGHDTWLLALTPPPGRLPWSLELLPALAVRDLDPERAREVLALCDDLLERPGWGQTTRGTPTALAARWLLHHALQRAREELGD